MSDTPMPFPCKDVGNPYKEQRQKLQQLVGITGNKVYRHCYKPHPFIHSRPIPEGICGHPSGRGNWIWKAGNGILLQDMPVYYTP